MQIYGVPGQRSQNPARITHATSTETTGRKTVLLRDRATGLNTPAQGKTNSATTERSETATEFPRPRTAARPQPLRSGGRHRPTTQSSNNASNQIETRPPAQLRTQATIAGRSGRIPRSVARGRTRRRSGRRLEPLRRPAPLLSMCLCVAPIRPRAARGGRQLGLACL